MQAETKPSNSRTMNKIIAPLLVICMMALNLTTNTSWEVNLSPDSVCKMIYNHTDVDKPITLKARSVEVEMYVEYGWGWRTVNVLGEPKTEISFKPGPAYIVPICDIRVLSNKKRHTDFALRVCAVAAPYWICNKNPNRRLSLNSRTPFSLQNALRCVAEAAQNEEGPLNANWTDPELVHESMMLFDDYEENAASFADRLRLIQPNVLYIGSMTLSFPGAVELARTAKQMFGDGILVVLGGRHVNETFYTEANQIKHHKGSPLLLMQQGKIDQVFDLVVSGDGEHISLKIAEIVQRVATDNLMVRNFFDHSLELSEAPGIWQAGWITARNEIETVRSLKPQDRSSLPIPAEVFGITSRFPIFGTDYTAHVYSDSSRGCVRDCSFCSERRSVAGGMQNPAASADRLFRQLLTVQEIGRINECSVSAFVEDSILLAGSPQYLSRLADLMEKSKFNMRFGGQFTVADLTNPLVQQQIQRLQQYGLYYIYTGMETINPEAAAAMSKNRKKNTPWLTQNTEAIDFVSRIGLKFGVSVLFGIGESQLERLLHLDTLAEWQREYQNPCVVSLNWATEHPLLNQSSHDFVEWGTNRDDPRLSLMQEVFGESSARYCFHPLPNTEELSIIAEKFRNLNNRT